MRVLLVNPPVSYYLGVQYKLNPTLGLPILAAVLEEAGHSCVVLDMEALGMRPTELLPMVRQAGPDPDVIGVTALTAGAKGAEDTVRALRYGGFGGKIVVGGVHATLFPEEPALWGAHLVVRGECEGNIVRLLEEGAGGIQDGEPPEMGDIPAPLWRRHSPAPKEYTGNPPYLLRPEGITMWTRGCPHRCLFCGDAVFGHQPHRFRPVANIVRDVQALRDEQGVKSLFVYDDELLGMRAPVGWWEELAERLEPLGVVWKCQGRCSLRYVTPEVLELAYRAGCRVVMWGVESFSQKVLDALHKDLTIEDIWHTLRAAKAAGMQNWVFTMLGCPQEGDAEARLTCEGLRQGYREGLVDWRQTTVLTALPGTELERVQKEDGWYHQPPESGPLMHQTYADTPWMKAHRVQYWLNQYEVACPANTLRPARVS